MLTVDSAAEFRTLLEATRRDGRSVGLVPTMGALHEGHRSLIERARNECDVVAVTIFVNPLQFSDPDDIANYPRPLERDLAACRAAGATIVFAPPVEELYPNWPQLPATTVHVGGVSERWEGASRPGHFDGVATVVTKLFTLAGACRAYFGEKDFQQLAVIRTLVADLGVPVELVACPTVREGDGLALSSRNVRLAAHERAAAPVLAHALAAGQRAAAAGEGRPEAVEAVMAAVVATEPLVELDYAAVVLAADLSRPARLASGGTYRLLIAARVGPVRLIDNAPLAVASSAPADTASVIRVRQPVGAR